MRLSQVIVDTDRIFLQDCDDGHPWIGLTVRWLHDDCLSSETAKNLCVAAWSKGISSSVLLYFSLRFVLELIFASSTHKTIKNNNKNYYCLYTTGSNHCYCLPWCFLLIPALCLFALLCCSLFKHSGRTLSPSVLLELQQELSEWWHNGESEAKVENSQQRRRRRNQPEHLWTNIT